MVVNRGLIINVRPLNTCQSMFFVGLVDFQDYIIFCHAFLEIKYICIKLTLDVAVYENQKPSEISED